MEDHEFRRAEIPKIWDNTMRSMFVSCPRKLYFFLRRFTYANADVPIYFTFGRAAHAGLLTWHTSTVADPYMRAAHAVSNAEALWDGEAAVDNPPTNTKANLRAKLLAYAEEYGPTEDWSFIPRGGEAGWIWPLGKWELAGAMDGYVNWPGRGIFALEHKTTSQYLIPNYREQWHFATQISGYVWYLHQILPKEEIFGAMINLITKNIKGPRSKWKYPEFDRELIRKLPWQLEKFEEDFIHDLSEAERCWNDWSFPQRGMTNAAQCTGGPGMSPCLFRGICRTPVALADIDIRRYVGIVETNEPWQPWAREGDS